MSLSGYTEIKKNCVVTYKSWHPFPDLVPIGLTLSINRNSCHKGLNSTPYGFLVSNNRDTIEIPCRKFKGVGRAIGI